MVEPLIIEVRANEWVKRDANPHVPYSPQEIAESAIACRQNGASIFHFHLRDPKTGDPSADPALYAEAVRLIRASPIARDLVLMPTNFLTDRPPSLESGMERIAPLMEIAKSEATRPELGAIDMVTCNVDFFDEASNTFRTESRIYSNTTEICRLFAERFRAAGLGIVPFLWNATSVAFTQCFLRMGLLDDVRWCELVMTHDGLWAHPASRAGLDAYLAFMPAEWRWGVFTNRASIFGEVAEHAMSQPRGHIVIGLGDHHYRDLDPARFPDGPTNGDLVSAVAALARAHGRPIATPSETREMLGLPARP